MHTAHSNNGKRTKTNDKKGSVSETILVIIVKELTNNGEDDDDNDEIERESKEKQ